MQTDLNCLKQIILFLKENINRFTSIRLKVISIEDLSSKLCDDPGNELLFIATLTTEDENQYYSQHEPAIDTIALSDAMQDLELANGDHCLTVENYIGLNTTILLPITLLS